jgi:hypothetical protein
LTLFLRPQHDLDQAARPAVSASAANGFYLRV